MPQQVTIVVRGVVQGVGFRWHTRRQAEALGLSGSVRNLPDGAVRIVARGERPQLEALAAWARVGPPHAEVVHVETSWSEADDAGGGFAVTG